jgi:hypothetical protein
MKSFMRIDLKYVCIFGGKYFFSFFKERGVCGELRYYMRGVVPPFPEFFKGYVFIAWYLIKHWIRLRVVVLG